MSWRQFTPCLNARQLDDLTRWERGGILDTGSLLHYARTSAGENLRDRAN
jgi:hypothetical protein